MKMLTVCKDHVKKGLNAISVPHVQFMSDHTNKTCSYCGQQAKLKLFLPFRTTAKAI